VNLRERLPWEPLLTDEEVQRAQGYYGSGHSMRRVAAKLLAGQPIKVATLGGSVTRGTGASRPAHTYASRFFQLLNASFPHRDHVFRNSGLGATTSPIFAGCTDQLVPPDVDMVVLEFTYNEAPGAGYSGAARRSFELLLRRLLHQAGPPALVMLHHYAWFMTRVR
jgi:lysophospholipase L1-like esterase